MEQVTINIDRSRLSEKEVFEAYQHLIEEVSKDDRDLQHRLQDFELVAAKPIFESFSNGRKLIGIELIKDKKGNPLPVIRTARIRFKHAEDHNRQILNANEATGWGTYFLIKQS